MAHFKLILFWLIRVIDGDGTSVVVVSVGGFGQQTICLR